MRLQEAELSWRWWTLSFRGICLLMTPTFSDSVSHIFDHLVRRRRNTSLLPKGWTVTGSMTKLARAAIPPLQGLDRWRWWDKPVLVARDCRPCPEGHCSQLRVFPELLSIYEMPSLSFYMQLPELKILAMNSTFYKTQGNTCAPPSPLPRLCPVLLCFLPLYAGAWGGVSEIWHWESLSILVSSPFAGLLGEIGHHVASSSKYILQEPLNPEVIKG